MALRSTINPIMARLLRALCLVTTFYLHCLLLVEGGSDKIFVTDVFDRKISVGENTGPDFHGENITEISLSGVQAPVGIDYDYRTGMIYWTDEEARTINRASLDGSNQQTLLSQSQGIGHPQGLVVDTLSNKIYWSDTLLETIMIANLDGSNRRTLINSDLYLPWGITLSQKRGTLFWTDEGVSTGKIEMCNKDGTNRRNLITTRIRQPFGVALDSQEQRLYWTDGFYDLIESINLDRWSDRTDHVYAASGDIVVFGVSLYFSSIYFTDFASSGLHEADFGVEEIRTLTEFTGTPTHVRVYADLTCSSSCVGNSRCELVSFDTPGCTCIYGWEGVNCGTRVMCYATTAPAMTSFIDPHSSYSASTTVTVRCDNGNAEVVWTCNGYTGDWEEEPIDCTQDGGEGGASPALIGGIAGGVVGFLVLMMCFCLAYRSSRKPPRTSPPNVQNATGQGPTVVFVAANRPGPTATANANVAINQNPRYHPGPSGASVAGAPVGGVYPPNAGASAAGAYPSNAILEEKKDPDLDHIYMGVIDSPQAAYPPQSINQGIANNAMPPPYTANFQE